MPPKAHVAALALARGASIVEAAAAAGAHERTVRRWLDLPEFRAEVRAIRDKLTSEALALLTGTLDAAVRKLRELLKSSDERVALRACKIVIDSTVNVRTQVEVLEELARLEDALRGLQERGKL